MLFVSTKDLKAGMKLAKPIYSKQGVLLYDRESYLTKQAIKSISNFGLFGLYILEPAEPAPPISKEELEFERFQTMYMFRLKEELDLILAGKTTQNLHNLVQTIILQYGHLNHKFTFNQTLRSTDDYTYKHSLNVSILCAMIGSVMHLDNERLEALVTAALLHDLGMMRVPKKVLDKSRKAYSEDDLAVINKHMQDAIQMLQPEKNPNDLPDATIRILSQVNQFFYHPNYPANVEAKYSPLAKILQVANEYDALTAMNLGHEPSSEIVAVNFLFAHPDYYDRTVVRALTEAIHIVPRACCVELSDGERCLVLEENSVNFMTPVILRFSDNKVIDLSDPEQAQDIHIIDIMRTMDNRITIDEETLKHFNADKSLSKAIEKYKKKKIAKQKRSLDIKV